MSADHAFAARRLDDIAVGETLPAFTVAVTLQRLVMEAGANRDFSPTHFDPVAAAEAGAPAVFANTTFVETLLEAAIRSWAGLSPRIAMMEFSMRDMTCVGDVVSVTGTVTGKGTHRGTPSAELDVWLESHRGRTVVGAAVVVFPGADRGQE